MRLTLERKFIGLASAIIAACSFVANIFIVDVYRNQLFSEAERRALVLAASAAISFTNTLLYQERGLIEEDGLLNNYIQDLLANSMAAVTHVMVVDASGGVLASDDHRQYIQDKESQAAQRWMALAQPQIVQDREDPVFQIAYPLENSGKRLGTLLMQFSRQSEFGRADAFKRWMFIVSLAFAVVGVLIASLVARTLASPIKKLATEMAKVEVPTYEANIAGKRRDEIGELERGFEDMLGRLRTAAEEQDHQQKALIQTEKLAAIGTLVSGLAHEINNPLAGIRNCLRRIIASPRDAAQTKKYAKLMDSALLRIENIIRDLLNFSRKKEIMFQPIAVNDIITASCHLVELRLKKQRVRLDLSLSKDLPTILGDAQHLEQVFVNLLLNAVDATDEGGQISVVSEATENGVLVDVKDTGKGIPLEIKHSIFDPFVTTKPSGKGTGLGLAVTKEIIDEHKGQICFTSSSTGTVFRVMFPSAKSLSGMSSQDVSAAILAGGTSSRMGQNKALLFVDGKPMIARVVDSLREQFEQIVVISNQQQEYRFLNLPVYPDAVANFGPLAGIYTALQRSQTEHCLVVACDLPFLSRQLIRFLCENCAPYDVLAFESESGVEPLCAVYKKKCLPVIKAQIELGEHKVSQFYDKVRTRIVRMEPGLVFYSRHAFLNVNTPDELARAQKLLRPDAIGH
ncbi:MAG: NTP transferase domain-containing protein [bacterium]